MHLFSSSKCVISLLYVQSNGECIFAFLNSSIDAYLASMRLAVTFGDELTLAVCAHIYSLRIRTISNTSAAHDREYTPFYTDNPTHNRNTDPDSNQPEYKATIRLQTLRQELVSMYSELKATIEHW